VGETGQLRSKAKPRPQGNPPVSHRRVLAANAIPMFQDEQIVVSSCFPNRQAPRRKAAMGLAFPAGPWLGCNQDRGSWRRRMDSPEVDAKEASSPWRCKPWLKKTGKGRPLECAGETLAAQLHPEACVRRSPGLASSGVPRDRAGAVPIRSADPVGIRKRERQRPPHPAKSALTITFSTLSGTLHMPRWQSSTRPISHPGACREARQIASASLQAVEGRIAAS